MQLTYLQISIPCFRLFRIHSAKWRKI